MTRRVFRLCKTAGTWYKSFRTVDFDQLLETARYTNSASPRRFIDRQPVKIHRLTTT